MITEEVITPEMARSLLKRNQCNRHVSEPLVKDYANAMRDGRWKVNGQTISIRSDGVLADGQHRLLACVKTGVSFRTYVVRGVEQDAVNTIDTGRKRSSSDVLQMAGCQNAKTVAAGIRWIAAIRDGVSEGNVRLQPVQIHAVWLLDRDKLGRSAAFGMMVRTILPPSMAAALHYLFAEFDEKRADEFFERLAKGADLASNSPIYVLRERLIRSRTEKYPPDSMEKISLCIRAWNHTRGEKMTTRLLRGTIKNEDGDRRIPNII